MRRIESERIDQARALLTSPGERSSPWAALAAAALMAGSAVMLAGAVVLGPGFDVSAQLPID